MTRQIPWLTLLILLPWVGALACIRDKRVGVAFSFAPLLIVAELVREFGFSDFDRVRLAERQPWIPSLGAEWFAGLDGLGLLCVLLTALIVPFALLAGKGDARRTALMLSLQGALIGSFTALNFVHWFLFWELSLVPAYFLIRLDGGASRARAANSFFLYTKAGSVAMLLAMVAVFRATGTFDFQELAWLGRHGEVSAALRTLFGASSAWPTLVFFGVLVGVAVKVPLYPLHTWLPAAYGEAPPSVTMVLTGVMSKMGLYGMLRVVLPLFPDQVRNFATPLLWLAAAGIVLSAWAACAQTDLRRMLAYSSINHLGYCLLGIFAAATRSPAAVLALNGVLLQIFNHGLIAATLFAGVCFLETRLGGRATLNSFGGLRAIAPGLSAFLGIAWFASIGLPGLSGFVGEFLIFQGSFALAPGPTALAALGLLLTTVFMLGAWKKIFHGPIADSCASMRDLNARERILLAAAVLLMIVLGICPAFLLAWLNPLASDLAQP